MSTGVIIALIVVVAVVLVAAAVLALRARGPQHGGSLKRRFGPEYDLAVARHDGDTKAAERELTERVRRHGSLRTRPLESAERERFEARWTAAQERFVDSPREAVAEADRLLAELAGARGFPDGGQYEEQLTALSVHHAHHVEGYRRVHRVTHARVDDARDGGGAGTEEMRASMVEARALFEALMRPARHDGGDGRRTGTEAGEPAPAPTRAARAPHGWSLGKRRPKES
ncbi:hypothetical protein ADL35_16775 [Streptomyces sp. NRRL WC-3753]|uniref:hypothetical protein n=1 Tax=Streptomyces coelicoflavus TaxID=285562 RepID=UPI0006B9E3B5|nr:hypothetical protein [Streptomyces coelicoflavus]KPC85802.1 hypothetical protein ADL35_16775 [Streptomyces sp. NRRL WC-3753]